jgi:hypothetical protein
VVVQLTFSSAGEAHNLAELPEHAATCLRFERAIMRWMVETSDYVRGNPRVDKESDGETRGGDEREVQSLGRLVLCLYIYLVMMRLRRVWGTMWCGLVPIVQVQDA